jgi:hypothetical protein
MAQERTAAYLLLLQTRPRLPARRLSDSSGSIARTAYLGRWPANRCAIFVSQRVDARVNRAAATEPSRDSAATDRSRLRDYSGGSC